MQENQNAAKKSGCYFYSFTSPNSVQNYCKNYTPNPETDVLSSYEYKEKFLGSFE